MKKLSGCVAIVTGASRGGGRGIALALGEQGATVYVTGRSVRGNSTRSDLSRATITDTAEAVTEQGGTGIAVRCDHTQDRDVAALFERVKADTGGQLDVLVNNVWGGYEDVDNAFGAPFWEQPLDRWERMFRAGVRAHFVASQHAARLMIPRKRGLIVSTTFWDRGKFITSTPYDLAKNAVNRLCYDMGLELLDHRVAVLAVSPGWMRTEAVLDQFGLPTDDSARDLPEELRATESVFYLGRAIVALATDREVLQKTGRVIPVGDLAREYAFTDIDGSQPEAFQLPEAHTRD